MPKYYFAAVLAESANKTYQAIGFWMEHKNYGYSGDSYATASMMKEHAMSIDNLEKLTGIDFFCNLPNALENNVEASYSEGAWSWKWLNELLSWWVDKFLSLNDDVYISF